MPAHKSGKTNRKHGRNKVFSQRYTIEGRLEKNKKKTMARHLARHPNETGQKGPVDYTRKRPYSTLEINLQKILDKQNKVCYG